MKRRWFLRGIIGAVAGALLGCGLKKEPPILQMEETISAERIARQLTPLKIDSSIIWSPRIEYWTYGQLAIAPDGDWLRITWQPAAGRKLTLRLRDGRTFWKIMAEAEDAVDLVQEGR